RYMFFGRYEHSLDSKGRLTLPSEYAGDLAAGVVLTRGMENCVYLFPKAEFERISGRLSTLSMTDSRVRKLKRWLFSNAQMTEPDRQRRVIVPQRLREIARITDKVLIAGMDSYIELWQPEAWDEHDLLLEQEAADEDFFASLAI
ncbi:MAG: division/cell wall cluster transcriptional repressor MraZ, partial [Anaerolineae bacterium]|nr:division/cell wall cluster transcriptional repressor MraZ [Anaerolineae bacterium]